MKLSEFEIKLVRTLNSRRPRTEPEWSACALAIKEGLLQLGDSGRTKPTASRATQPRGARLRQTAARQRTEAKLKKLGFDIPWERYELDVIDTLS